MKPEEQEKFFRLVQKHFPDWSSKRVSGYIHGVVDGLKRSEPRRVYVRLFKKTRPYAIGYIYGFIDAYGVDALMASWSQDLPVGSTSMQYRWWMK